MSRPPFLAGAVLLGVPWLYTVGRMLVRARRARGWSHVEAVVREARLVETTDSDGDPQVEPRIAYEYVVDGRTLRGTRIAFDRDVLSPARGADWLARHAPGTPIAIRVDPLDVACAVMETRSGNGPPAIATLLGAMLILDLVMAASWGD